MNSNTDDEKNIRALIDEYVAAWNRDRDPKACAALYTPDGDLLAADGEFLGSPMAIERYYVDRLGGAYANFHVAEFEIFSLRTIARDVALADARWDLVRTDDAGVAQETVASLLGAFVVAKPKGIWRISAARVMVPMKLG